MIKQNPPTPIHVSFTAFVTATVISLVPLYFGKEIRPTIKMAVEFKNLNNVQTPLAVGDVVTLTSSVAKDHAVTFGIDLSTTPPKGFEGNWSNIIGKNIFGEDYCQHRESTDYNYTVTFNYVIKPTNEKATRTTTITDICWSK